MEKPAKIEDKLNYNVVKTEEKPVEKVQKSENTVESTPAEKSEEEKEVIGFLKKKIQENGSIDNENEKKPEKK